MGRTASDVFTKRVIVRMTRCFSGLISITIWLRFFMVSRHRMAS